MNRWQILLGGGLLAVGAVYVFASDAPLADVTISSDTVTVRRGAETVVTVCMNCHGLKYIKYRDLLDIGVDRDTLNLWKGDKDLNSALVSLTPPDVARDTYGVVPPDLSLITAARRHGGRYVYSMLTGFYSDEQGFTANRVFPGIAMPDVLGYSFAGNDDERHQIEHTARDVAGFLTWAAEPTASFRTTLGVGVIVYLVILTSLLYLWKRRIWRRLDGSAATAIRES
jgi:cytochrome c1